MHFFLTDCPGKLISLPIKYYFIFSKDYAKDPFKDAMQKKGDPTYRLGQYSDNGGLTQNDAKQLRLLYKCRKYPFAVECF